MLSSVLCALELCLSCRFASSSCAGQQLAGTRYSHPLDSSRVASVLVGGDYVTADSGTGLVHSAPGHGQEDYMVRWS